MPNQYTISTVQIYDGLIPDMRKQGATLQEIANVCGTISRERIRQILNQYYPHIKRGLIAETNISRIFHCNPKNIRKLRISNKIKPVKISISKRLILYSKSQLPEISRLLIRHCDICGKEIPLNRRKRCPECAEKIKRNRWPILSKEGKQKRNQAMLNWRQNNPEKNKEIHHRAGIKFYKKNREKYFTSQRYIVIKEDTLPMGAIFSATKKEGIYLILANGIKIPVFRVKRLYPEINIASGKIKQSKKIKR